jgi:hypothetical protein
MRGAALCAALACLLFIAVSPSGAAHAAQWVRPPRTSKVNSKVVKAIECVMKQGRTVRSDVLLEGEHSYTPCEDEAKSDNPKWQVIEENGNSMIEFAQFTLPSISAEESGLATYLKTFSSAYHDAH